MTSLLREMERFFERGLVSGNEAQYKSPMVPFPRIATHADERTAFDAIENAQTALQRHVGDPSTSVAPIAVEGIPVRIDESQFAQPTFLIDIGVPRVEIEIAPHDLAPVCDGVAIAMA